MYILNANVYKKGSDEVGLFLDLYNRRNQFFSNDAHDNPSGDNLLVSNFGQYIEGLRSFVNCLYFSARKN